MTNSGEIKSKLPMRSSIDSEHIDAILKEQSLVPTIVSSMVKVCRDGLILCHRNAFSERLTPLGFHFFSMFVVDLMHDFELGIWKFLFIHLI